MNLFDIFRLSVINILRGRIRIFLTILAISIGIAAVIIISTVGECGKHAVGSTLEKIGASGIMIIPKTKSNVKSVLYADDAKYIKDRLQSVEHAMPLVIKYGRYRQISVSDNAVIWGVDENLGRYIGTDLVHGRMISRADVLGSRQVAIIDSAVAMRIYKRENVVGKKITLNLSENSGTFEIIGIMKPQTGALGGMISSQIPTFIYTPYSSVLNLTGQSTVDQIILRQNAEFDSEHVQQQAVAVLGRLHPGSSGYEAENITGYRDTLDSVLFIITLVLSATAGISLFVAGIGVMNTMLSSVGERRREVGICKAVGASRSQIAFEFLFESALLSLIGGILGALIGLALAYLLCVLTDMQMLVNIEILLLAEGVTILAGLLFGVAPAVRASGLDPIDALREV